MLVLAGLCCGERDAVTFSFSTSPVLPSLRSPSASSRKDSWLLLCRLSVPPSVPGQQLRDSSREEEGIPRGQDQPLRPGRLTLQADSNRGAASSLGLSCMQDTRAVKHAQAPGSVKLTHYLMMRPTLPEKQDDSAYDFNSLTFLLGTKHKQILFDLYIEQQRYREILKAIDYRSSLHFNKVQPALIKAGMQEGIDYPGNTFGIVLGQLLYRDLKQTTENIIDNVDKNVISLIEVKDKMLSAFNDIFPDVKFINIEPL
jgi:hypothetical protein